MEEENKEFDKAVYDYVKIYAEMAGVPAIANIFVSRCSKGKIFTEQTKRYTDNIELQDRLWLKTMLCWLNQRITSSRFMG